jgi:hypothetical protein
MRLFQTYLFTAVGLDDVSCILNSSIKKDFAGQLALKKLLTDRLA